MMAVVPTRERLPPGHRRGCEFKVIQVHGLLFLLLERVLRPPAATLTAANLAPHEASEGGDVTAHDYGGK
jgi:hypothetical protein